jgi:hypothetical protein
MYTTKDKYLPLLIKVKKNPTIIVGQNPGKTREGKYSPYVWDGDTRTSNLLREAVKGHGNLILTNICNYQKIDLDTRIEGWQDFIEMFNQYQPKKIICLGEYAFRDIEMLATTKRIRASGNSGTAIYKLQHPSYIVRFNKDREEYIKEKRGILCQDFIL